MRVQREVSWSTVSRRLVEYCVLLLFCLASWALILKGCIALAHASPLDCEGIKDSDQRHYCRAVSIPRKSECSFIKDNDLRRQCRAIVK